MSTGSHQIFLLKMYQRYYDNYTCKHQADKASAFLEHPYIVYD